jgi:hypothetical protein
MIRALTIRFAIICVGLSMWVAAANLLHVPGALAWVVLIAYMGAGVVIIGNYCAAHEEEIPTRSQRRRHRHR